ncbi:MAG: TonB-dependent receptor [Prevotellaceae bacterium]|jgi:TonB-linked SusC/RagA family outer membrane protein|nr:TonB-dependent receptor [Prevotellaceae bacterium]
MKQIVKIKMIQYVQISLLSLFMGLLSLQVDAQQSIQIRGSVYDESNQALAGVNVIVRGTTQGTMTDDNGEYSIAVSNDSSVLIFALVGFQDQEIQVGKRRIITVILKEQAEQIEALTIVAFGKQKRESVITSVESVKVADLRVPASNMTSSFAGRIPGMISYQTSGEPGNDNAQFFVRGVTSFGYKTDPLILIDGFEATSDDLARMQPDDIESFSILKDALATVLYGARGANGIITVTTKAGFEGDVKVSARLDTHVATPTRMLELLDGVEYMRLYNQAQMSRHPELGPWYREQKIQSTAQGVNPMIFPNINWYDAMFNKATVNTKANVNVSGGGKIATYYVAGGYDYETGLLKVDKMNNFNNNIAINRFHLRTNVIFKLSSTTMLDTRIQGRFEKYNGPPESAGDLFGMVMDANPVDFPAIYQPDAAHQYTRHILFGNTILRGNNLKTNPYARMVRGYETRDANTLSVQATLMQDLDFITKGLKLQAKVSANTNSSYSGKRNYNPYYYSLDSYNEITGDYTLYNLNPTNTTAALGNVEADRDGSTKYYFEARMNWDRKFGKHLLGLMAVAIAEENILTDGKSTDIYETLPERNAGISGRFVYDYDSRYFFEFSYGYNGSEKFTGDKRYGFFPAVGAGWILSNESFWSSMKNAVSLLKLKFTWGQVGNDAIAKRAGRFFFLSDIGTGGGYYSWGNSFTNMGMGYSINRYANPDITWEVSEKYNLGFELGLLKDEALKIQVDVFQDTRNNIYMARENFPATAGFEAAIHGNVGKVSLKGIEGSIDLQHSFSKDFWMTGRMNFTYATNKYLEKDEKNYPDEYLKTVGHHSDQSWGLVAERLFVDELEIANSPDQSAFGIYQAGDIKYLDVNKDGIINTNDRIPMGYPTKPEIQYGFGLSVGYKNLDLSFFFQGNARVSFYIAPDKINPFNDRRNAPTIIARDSWSETNPDVHAFWPRLSPETIANNVQQSSWWLRDGSFLRLKTIELGYNMPDLKKIFIQSSRIYLSVENAFYFSAFKLWDPEVGGNGLGYPLNRRFNVGLQLFF